MRDVQAAAGTPLTQRSRGPVLAVLGLVAVLAFGLDLATKAIVLANVKTPIPVIDGFLNITLTYNPGAAFSIATGMTWVLTIIACVVVIAILRFARKLRSVGWAISLGLLLGGALGNLFDRIFRPPGPFEGHVVDWIQLPHWPVFNLADSAIVCGGALAVLLSWRGVGIDGTREPKKSD